MSEHDDTSFRDATFGCCGGVHDDRDDAEGLADGSHLYEALSGGGVKRRRLDPETARLALNVLSVAPAMPHETRKPKLVPPLATVIPFPSSRWHSHEPPPNSAA